MLRFAVLVLLAPSVAAAQVVVVPVSPEPPPVAIPAPPPPPSVAPTPPCGYGGTCQATSCPPCSPGAPCPVCVDGSVSIGDGVVVDGVTVEGATQSVGAGGSAPPGDVPDPTAVAPAPGTLELGYVGGTDLSSAFHGFVLRTTGHVGDLYFVDVVLGGTGSDARPSVYELFGLVGFRVAAAVATNLVRIFGAIDLGLAARGIGETGAWGAFAAEGGLGIEIGLGAPFTVGFFTDVRAITRVPFEREPGWIGIGWSAGLAVLWF